MWKRWIRAKKILQKGLRFLLGDGKTIRIWESLWLDCMPNFKPKTRKPKGCNLKWVSKLMQDGGRSWNTKLIYHTFNKRDVETIVQIPISQLRLQDKFIWHHTRNGRYTVDSAYNLLAKQRNLVAPEPESSKSREKKQAIWRGCGI